MPSQKVAESRPAEQPVGDEIANWRPLHDVVRAAVASAMSDIKAWSGSADELRRALDLAVVGGLKMALDVAAERWAVEVLGAERYARSGERRGHLGGTREHTFGFAVGSVTIRVPKPRRGPSRPEWVPALKEAPQRVLNLVREMWVRGMSYRDLARVTEELSGTARSHTTVGEWVRDVADETLKWLNRPIGKEFRYLMLDGIYVPVVRDTSTKEPILVALGITADGHKEILDLFQAPSESIESWGTLLGRLKMRGLPVDELRLVITDGDQGVIEALAAHLPKVPRQRCTLHKVKNVVGNCPRSLKSTAPAEAAAIFKAPSRDEARKRAAAFIAKYDAVAPKLARIIEDDLDACLRFYDFDARLWAALRTTNALERTNRELRRKFREVGAMEAEHNVTRVAVTVARFINREMQGEPIAGFRIKRSRART